MILNLLNQYNNNIQTEYSWHVDHNSKHPANHTHDECILEGENFRIFPKVEDSDISFNNIIFSHILYRN